MIKKFVRKLTRVSSHSYVLNIPKELMKKFGWRERQKLTIAYGGKRKKLLIRDWKPKRKNK